MVGYVSTSTEVDADLVNAIHVNDNEVLIPGLSSRAMRPRGMLQLYPEPEFK
jgi:hypothetical protein